MKIEQRLLTPNTYSRPGIKLEKVTKIAVHYAGDSGASATNMNKYFESLKDQVADKTGKYWANSDGSIRTYKGQKITLRWVSSHYSIGLDGEIIQNIPLDEWSYCTNQANGYSISIECCHPDSTGKFNAATENSLVELCAYLCKKFNLSSNDIIRHYDVTGKICPRYWAPYGSTTLAVANQRFTAFKQRVAKAMGQSITTEPVTENKVNNVSTDSSKPIMRVKVIASSLNIRSNPGTGTGSKIVGVIKGGGIYTIVETKMVGNVQWGKLKSGAGWISLNSKYVKKV